MQRVFHSIRFKVNKGSGSSGYPFFILKGFPPPSGGVSSNLLIEHPPNRCRRCRPTNVVDVALSVSSMSTHRHARHRKIDMPHVGKTVCPTSVNRRGAHRFFGHSWCRKQEKAEQIWRFAHFFVPLQRFLTKGVLAVAG